MSGSEQLLEWSDLISGLGEPKVSTSDLTLSQGEERGPAQHQLAANGRQDQTGKRVASNSMYGHAAKLLLPLDIWQWQTPMGEHCALCKQAGMSAAQDSCWLGLQQPSADVSSLPGGDRRRSRQRLFP
jgi:hypothetical protein